MAAGTIMLLIYIAGIIGLWALGHTQAMIGVIVAGLLWMTLYGALCVGGDDD